MTTLYVHPADDNAVDEYEVHERYTRKKHYSSKRSPSDDQNGRHRYTARHDRRHRHHHHRSPRHLRQNTYRSYPSSQQYKKHSNNNMHHDHDNYSEAASSQNTANTECTQNTHSSTVPPPALFFPFNDDEEQKQEEEEHANTNNIKHTENNKIFPALPQSLANLSNLPALPPLSALTSNDGKLLNLNVEDLSHLNKLSVDEIRNELNGQRLKNEALLAKLHNDQKKFLKVCKHYEKKNGRLQERVVSVAKKNKTSVQSAKVMKSLLVEHKSVVDLNQNENIQCQVIKGNLWKGISTNMQLLSEVNTLNKQIDAYHLLIAKKNQEIGQQTTTNKDIVNDDDQKTEQQPTKEQIYIDDDSKEEQLEPPKNNNWDTMSIGTNNGGDPTANYAEQLIARNKRYHEILALLRKKVDELRACRKKI